MRLNRLTYRMLVIQCTVVLLVIFITFSFLSSSKWRRSHVWEGSSSWYPRIARLVSDVDSYLWTSIEMDELGESTEPNTAAADLSERFYHHRRENKLLRTFLKNVNESSSDKRLGKLRPGFIDPDDFPLEYCPEQPPNLKGRLTVPDIWKFNPPTLKEIAKKYPNHKDATSKPFDCKARYRVAIIIPLRGREMQLRALLEHMHPVWQRQQLDYTVYLVTQSGKQLFNRAKLMNVGFAEATKERKYDCFVFHDVDLLAENDHCSYWCPQPDYTHRTGPRHLSTYIDKFGYEVHTYDLGLCSPLAYQNMNVEVFGGVSMFTEDQFVSVNGFSNMYWGWGAEDDDLFMRTWKKGYKVTHDTGTSCSYHMIYHSRERTNRKNAVRFLLLKHAISRQNQDGLSNLRYKVLSRVKTSIYTNITVNIGGPSKGLRDMMRKVAIGSENIDSYSCFESLVWLYHKLVKKKP